MNADSRLPNDDSRWARLINGASKVMEYPWSSDYEQYKAAMALLDQVRQDFPADYGKDNFESTVVRCLADALHEVLTPSTPYDFGVVRSNSCGFRIVLPEDNDR